MKTLLRCHRPGGGAGHIGSWFAGLCRGLGAHTVGLKRDVSRPVEGFDRLAVMEELDGLLPQADVVALMLPPLPQTEGLMDARRLRLMKEDAILLSMGRAPCWIRRRWRPSWERDACGAPPWMSRSQSPCPRTAPCGRSPI